ncbi:MAG: EAL domain-containing protein [Clostridiales bacterium]|nr:EAL domain-containing protein [Clostridiales bacterium]
MYKKITNTIEETLLRISEKQQASKSLYVLLIILYYVVSYLVRTTSSSEGIIPVGQAHIPVSVFAGVFSAISNISIIFLVVFFDRLGYITSLIMMTLQFPMMILTLVKSNSYMSIPGVFSNLLMMVAISILFVNNRKVRRFQKKLVEQAVKDNLTGLPNAYACSQLRKANIKNDIPFAQVSIDINNFKSINDTVGQEIGNRVLQLIGARWMELADSGKTGTNDFIARHSGDEFKLIISGVSDEQTVYNTINQYKESLEEKISIDNFDFHLNACFGFALFPEDERTADSIFSYADAAMYEVKRTKSIDNQILRFKTDFIRNIEYNIEMESKLREALENDTVFYNLQPQFDITHRLRGFEALARMKDSDGSIISPGDFIPVAEKVGLIDNIDMCVLKKSAEFLGSLIKETGTDISISVNVSARHLMKKGFLEELKEAIDEYGVPPGQLEVELTESVMIDSADKAIECINAMKDMGIKIAIDDFGTGYSSLSYLNKFPANLLKIDKSFIDKMNTSESSVQYVAAIISLGHIMHFDVISEGVEEEEQLETLQNIGCDLIQGFIWGRPLPPEEARQLVIDQIDA